MGHQLLGMIMYYTEHEKKQCASPLSELQYAFNRRCDAGDEINEGYYLASAKWVMDDASIAKCIYELEYQIQNKMLQSDWSGNPLPSHPEAIEYANWKIQRWRKAWKGLQIAAYESGLTVPHCLDGPIKTRLDYYKQQISSTKI